MKNFESKHCLITGGGSGIGAAVAKQLADFGAYVTICGRTEDKLQKIADSHENISAIQLDVTNDASWQSLKDKLSEKSDCLDLIVLNAGTCEYVDLPEFDPEMFKRVFDVNFMGIVKGLHALLPMIRKSSHGHVAAVTSSVAALPLPRAEAYGSSKAAATYMLNTLRIALQKENIDVSVILPGFVESPMTDKNDFPMPAIIPPEKAAVRILKGLSKRKHEIYFPGRFTWPLRFLGILPSAIQQFFTKRLTK